MSWSIAAYSSVTPAGLFGNGALLFENTGAQEFNLFAKEAYRFIEPGYPKFFKMDELSKLAFLATEILLQKQEFQPEDGAETALILGNKNSSIASDTRHFESFRDRDNYFPSPAVFVYTLPNIMLGELCIRHQITGENTCFLMDQVDGGFLYRYVTDLLEHENYQSCITGWVDYCDGAYAAHLFHIRKGNLENRLFNKNFVNLINTRNG